MIELINYMKSEPMFYALFTGSILVSIFHRVIFSLPKMIWIAIYRFAESNFLVFAEYESSGGQYWQVKRDLDFFIEEKYKNKKRLISPERIQGKVIVWNGVTPVFISGKVRRKESGGDCYTLHFMSFGRNISSLQIFIDSIVEFAKSKRGRKPSA